MAEPWLLYHWGYHRHGICGGDYRADRSIQPEGGQVVPNQKDLKLDKYQISKFRFRELKNFCLQYREMKDKISEFTALGAISYSGTPGGGGISDPTFQKAAKFQQLKHDVEIIEQTAIAAGKEDYQSLLTNVTNTDMPYE